MQVDLSTVANEERGDATLYSLLYTLQQFQQQDSSQPGFWP